MIIDDDVTGIAPNWENKFFNEKKQTNKQNHMKTKRCNVGRCVKLNYKVLHLLQNLPNFFFVFALPPNRRKWIDNSNDKKNRINNNNFFFKNTKHQ